MGIHIVLLEPEIPANTGNIGRTCLATNSSLHLIHPLGFSLDDKMVRRAGLDYWENLHVHEHDSLEQLFATYPQGQFYFVEDYGTKNYSDVDFCDREKELFFIFGKESAGIPEHYLRENEESCLRIPMSNKVRSLNLSNVAAVVIYEVMRQQGFPNIL